MKASRPLLALAAASICSWSVQASELRPLDPGALRILGIAEPAAAPTPPARMASSNSAMPVATPTAAPAPPVDHVAATRAPGALVPMPVASTAASTLAATGPVGQRRGFTWPQAPSATQPVSRLPLSPMPSPHQANQTIRPAAPKLEPSAPAVPNPAPIALEDAFAPHAAAPIAAAAAEVAVPQTVPRAVQPPRAAATESASLPEQPRVRAATAQAQRPLAIEPAASAGSADPAPMTARAEPQAERAEHARASSPAPQEAKPAAWVARNGSTLRTTIQDWASTAGWAVHWNDERPDLRVIGTVEASGSFESATAKLFDIYQRSGASFAVELYPQQKLVLVRKD